MRARGSTSSSSTSKVVVHAHAIRATQHKHGVRVTQPDPNHIKARIVFAQEEIVRMFPRGLPEKRPRDLPKRVRAALAWDPEWVRLDYKPISRRTVMRAWRELQKK
jgi:hypothetical protein